MPELFQFRNSGLASATVLWPTTPRLLGSSFFWFVFRILQGNPKKELLGSLWVQPPLVALELQAGLALI